jgi:hypothetical protein
MKSSFMPFISEKSKGKYLNFKVTVRKLKKTTEFWPLQLLAIFIVNRYNFPTFDDLSRSPAVRSGKNYL